MREQLASLTGLRFFAAALVVLLHTGWLFPPSRYVKDSISTGSGVTFFYVLSGFILYYAHHDIRSRDERVRFVAARIARIWPLHLATLLFSLVAFAAPWGYRGDANATLKIWSNALLLQAWLPQAKYFFSLNGVSWSLSVELFFYVLFPFLIVDWQKTWMFKLLVSVGVAFAVVVSAECLGVTELAYGDPNLGLSTWVTSISPLIRLPEFLIGLAACRFWMSRRTSIASRSTATWTVVECVALFVTCITLSRLSHCLGLLGLGNLTTCWLTRIGPAPVFAALIVALASGRGHLSRLLGSPPLVFLGEISFALYMTHELLIRWLVTSARDLLLLDSDWAGFIVFWAIALAVASSASRLIERPARHAIVGLVGSWLARRPVARPVSAPT